MNAGFTPGPWLVDNGGIRARDAYLVKAVFNGTDSYFSPEAEANARLIAAAPDLYKALAGWMGRKPQDIASLMVASENALAKARGEA